MSICLDIFRYLFYFNLDIEDEIGSMKSYAVSDGGDFVTYNLFLLWIFPRASSMIMKLCVFFGLVVTIQLDLWLTYWFRKRWDESIVPGLPCPVVFLSTYALVLDFIQQNVDVDCVEMSHTGKTCKKQTSKKELISAIKSSSLYF
ncbi:unnamed protein product [Adineta ricciae]|uniref:Uncharacterized protein n=1 Tax=Adineta ricciae TaxID=249248 RepID=A0A814WFT2_ADIRI|nr:unnamed protein product [Adineta ricciae]CAF1204739.1 unnamed protein product [Adineta ricciae]